jgi:AraC-like DNA-binding protein
MTEANPPDARYFRLIAPTPPLAPYIREYRTLRGSAGTPTRSYPDGTLDLTINLGGPIWRLPQHGGLPQIAPAQAWLAGPAAHTDSYRFSNPVDLISVNIRPGAGMALFGMPLNDLRDQWIALDALWPPWAVARLDDLAGMPLSMQIRTLEAVLSDVIDERHMPMPVLRQSIALINASRGRATIRMIAAETGLSERTITRHFHTHVGLAPKQLSRVTRLWHVLSRMRADQRNLAAIALDTGYYDQAHFSNDILTLTGLTPATLLHDNQPDAFFQDEPAQLC